MGEHMWTTWVENEALDPTVRSELQELIDAGQQVALEESFAQNLRFGTGGMREKMGPGTNRMNIYTVRKASYGVAQWIRQTRPKQMWKIAIGYDGRRDSKRFAHEVACVAAACGIRAYLFIKASPTPFLSFAVRELTCGAGVMVTASHNPAEYNGYKVYDSEGGQVLEADAEQIMTEMNQCMDLFSIPVLTEQDARRSDLIHEVGSELETAYYRYLQPLLQVESAAKKSELTIVYTPLHGTGAQPVMTALRNAGYERVVAVEAQMALDAKFTHVQSPNPEDGVAYREAMQVAHSVNADIILATDPDCDRVGLMVKERDSEYTLLTGNEVGGLLLYDLLEHHRAERIHMTEPMAITTIVSSDFGEDVAASYGVRTERVLTGFKYIGAKIAQYERTGQQTFVFGYEESVGYLPLPFVRDKDAVQAAVAIANLAVRCKHEAGSVRAQLEQLYKRFGYYKDHLAGYQFVGRNGNERMKSLMEDFRERGIQAEGLDLEYEEDYQSLRRRNARTLEETPLHLPMSNVVKFRFANGDWIAVRPSGTEPKLKVYIGVKGSTNEEAEHRRRQFRQVVEARIAPYLN